MAILPLLLVFFISNSCSQNQSEQSDTDTDDHQMTESIPLIYHMSYISRYAKKLYFAGNAENWKLADIYNHEIEEISEGIVASNEMHDDINISQLMESMLLPHIESVEEAIDSGDRQLFLDRYNVMIQTCNQCHVASEYGAVKVTIPENNPFNQDFSPE